MGIERDTRARAAKNSWIVRRYYDTNGDLRAARALGTVAILAALVVGGTIVVSFAGAVAGPETLAIGALIVFLAIKLPLLALVFWILMRHGGGYTQAAISDRERSDVLEYLRSEARDAKGRPDEAERLRWAAREAWRIVDTCPNDQRPEAVAVAVAIGGPRPSPAGTTPI
ncbi:MAG: hypothetical protein EXQ74_02300 [Thermoleophilia bacterium]|nr:hypothetical protein [Thermoleophilia bacterium]